MRSPRFSILLCIYTEVELWDYMVTLGLALGTRLNCFQSGCATFHAHHSVGGLCSSARTATLQPRRQRANPVGSQSAVDSSHVSAGKADGSGWSEKSPESKLPGTTTGHGEDEIRRNGSRARAPLHPGPSDRTRALPSLLPAASRELRRAGARQCRDWLLVHR